MKIDYFKNFVEENPNWEAEYKIYTRDDPVFKRIKCVFDQHEYHPCINTLTGNIYLECRRRKIWAKHLVAMFATPGYTVAKTLWHLTIIPPLAYEIFKVLKGKQTLAELGTHTYQSLFDIIRTPAYGVVLTVLHLSSLILGSISPNSLYKTREIAGNLERELLRVKDIHEVPAIFTLIACFSPLRNIAYVRINGKTYATTKKDIPAIIRDFSKAQIVYQQNTRNIFNNCYRLLDPKKPYKSALLN